MKRLHMFFGLLEIGFFQSEQSISFFISVRFNAQHFEKGFVLPVDPFGIIKAFQLYIGHSKPFRKIVRRCPAFRIQHDVESGPGHLHERFKAFTS